MLHSGITGMLLNFFNSMWICPQCSDSSLVCVRLTVQQRSFLEYRIQMAF